MEKLYTMDEIFKAEIINRLHLLNGNKSHVAFSLGIAIKTLYNRLHKFDLAKIYIDNPGYNPVDNVDKPNHLGLPGGIRGGF